MTKVDKHDDDDGNVFAKNGLKSTQFQFHVKWMSFYDSCTTYVTIRLYYVAFRIY
jgi:hypothetical protein